MAQTSDPLWRDPLWRDLCDLRAELDRVDNALHDLLMARADVVRQVAGLRAHGKVALRPGREAQIIARLLARNHGALPAASVSRVWREILASSLSMQTDFAITVTCEELAAVAREQFGALTPVRLVADMTAALDLLRARAVTAVLLPAGALLDVILLKDLYVVARLPFWAARPDHTPTAQAWVIASTPPDPSDNDVSLLACGGQVFEIEGFLSLDDPRVAACGDDAVLLGAYAVPISGETI
jgi:chorismate mutase/prephenate dehydratase